VERKPRWWLRFDNEAVACPGCSSRRIRLLDACPVPRKPDGRAVAFLTGCGSCGLLFANPLPTREQLQSYYAEEGPWAAMRKERMDRLATAHARQPPLRKPRPKAVIPARARALFNALAPYAPVYAPPQHAKVLDFGCGDGKHLDRLQDHGWETYGIEPSTDVPFLRHRRLASPPADGTFDLVFLNHVLEHVIDPADLLRQLAGSLREGGVLFVSVPILQALSLRGFKTKFSPSAAKYIRII